MIVFDHEKLEVYGVACEYSDAADGIAEKLKRGNAHVRDQLRRASDSIVNNVAEGAGEVGAFDVEAEQADRRQDAEEGQPDEGQDDDDDEGTGHQCAEASAM